MGSGKTALTLALCLALRDRYNLAVVTNDIYTRKTPTSGAQRGPGPRADHRRGNRRLPAHRDSRDASINLEAVDQLNRRFPGLDLIIVESGGDNLSATFSPELSGPDHLCDRRVRRRQAAAQRRPGICKSDLLVINKVDLAPLVGASLEVMERDTLKMRGDKPFVFSNQKIGQGLEQDHRLYRTPRHAHRSLKTPLFSRRDAP